MLSIITPLLTYLTILLQIVFVFLVLAYAFRSSWGKEIIDFVSKQSLRLGLLVTSGAVIGSLLYSNIVGFEPCELCWWQRIFLFPQMIIFLVAIIKKKKGVFSYIVPLSIIGAVISFYHSYIQLGGETSILPCTAEGAACTKVFVLEYGYITIPTMALTAFLFILLLAFIRRFSPTSI